MFYVVVIVSIVHEDLTETALWGKPCLINLVSGIVVICCANRFYQFLIIFWSGIIETLDGTEKNAQIQQVYVRQVCCLHVELCIDTLLCQCVIEFLVILTDVILCSILLNENFPGKPVPPWPFVHDSWKQLGDK